MKVFWISWGYSSNGVGRAGGMSVQADDEPQARERCSRALARHIGPGFQAERLEILNITETGILKHQTI